MGGPPTVKRVLINSYEMEPKVAYWELDYLAPMESTLLLRW